jgi:hypothetical protein
MNGELVAALDGNWERDRRRGREEGEGEGQGRRRWRSDADVLQATRDSCAPS